MNDQEQTNAYQKARAAAYIVSILIEKSAKTTSDNAQPPFELELCCRRCGELHRCIDSVPEISSESGEDEIRSLIANSFRTAHKCKDGYWGVADLLGVSRGVTPVENESTKKEKPDFLPGGWVRINALLYSKGIKADYFLRLVDGSSENLLFCLMDNNGNRYANAFPAKMNSWGYVQLSEYREYFPQIME